jgi:hypothetical protein
MRQGHDRREVAQHLADVLADRVALAEDRVEGGEAHHPGDDEADQHVEHEGEESAPKPAAHHQRAGHRVEVGRRRRGGGRPAQHRQRQRRHEGEREEEAEMRAKSRRTL